MAISEPTITKEGLLDQIKTYYDNSNLIVFLISDPNGDLTVNSTFESIVGYELPYFYGYSRQILITGEPSIYTENDSFYAQITSFPVIFRADGGNIPLFTHAVVAKNTTTVPGNTSGKIIRIEPISESGIYLNDQEGYEYVFVDKHEVIYE